MKSFFLLLIIFTGLNCFGQKWEELTQEFIIYYNQGNYSKAVEFAEKSLAQAEKEFGKEHVNYGESLNYASGMYKMTGQYDKALTYYIETVEHARRILGEDNPQYGYRLSYLADLYKLIGDNDKSIECYLRVLKHTERVFGKFDDNNAINLTALASVYKVNGNFDLAMNSYLKSAEIIEKNHGKESVLYGKEMNNIGMCYHEMGNQITALSYYDQALLIYEKAKNPSNSEYATSLNNKASLLVEMGDYERAQQIFNDLLKFFDQQENPNYLQYGTYLNNFAGFYKMTENYDQALKMYGEVRDVFEYIKGKESNEYSIALNNLGSVYEDMGQYENALKHYVESLKIIELLYGKENSEYAKELNNIAGIYKLTGQNEKALPLFLEALQITANSVGIEHPEYGDKLNNLSGLLQNMGQYDKALALQLESISFIKDQKNPEYNKRLNNLAAIYQAMGNMDKALEYYSITLQLCEQSSGKESISYAISLNNLASVYSDINEYELASSMYEASRKIIQDKLGINTREFVTVTNNLAMVYCDFNQYEKAIKLIQESITSIEKNFNNNLVLKSLTLNNLGLLYQLSGLDSKAIQTYRIAKKELDQIIDANFTILTEQEKIEFISSVSLNFEKFQSYCLQQHSNYPTLGQDAYNTELMAKSLVLNSSIQMRKLIEQSSNKNALAIYSDWLAIKNKIAQQKELNDQSQIAKLNDLELQAEQLETQLSAISSAFDQNNSIAKINWKDVQKELKPNEVAIEFSSFQFQDGKRWADSIFYMALILKKNDTVPHLVHLFEQKQLDRLLDKGTRSEKGFVDRLYRGDSSVVLKLNSYDHLYDLLWKPIESYVPKGSTVYFAPSGSLNQLSFAAITNDDTLLSNQYNLIQLSTTAKLIKNPASHNEKNLPKSIILYGGITYNYSPEELSKTNKSVENQETVQYSFPVNVDRGTSWNQLPGTLKEIQAIEQLALKHAIQTKVFSGKEATEESFKLLSKDSPQVLHISTHGFFFPDLETKIASDTKVTPENNFFKSSNDPMNRSGILFAGANNTWQNDTLFKNTEDGILSSKEASYIPLSNTQLVVLSACETGLGSIKGSEGVFGLQRAFKAAGAQFIMMSLWKVPDIETAEFMTYFYQKWFEIKDIRKAFLATQNYMSAKYYGEPYKWAAFVLIE